MTARRWAAENSAEGAPHGIVLYDDDDDLFTVKTGDNEWTTYLKWDDHRHGPLRDSDINRDRGDQIVGQLEQRGSGWQAAKPYS